MYEVEYEVEMPSAGRKAVSYPFDEMAAGTSFFVPLEGSTARAVQSRLYAAFRRWDAKNIRHQFKLSAFAVTEGTLTPIEGVRAFMVEKKK